MQIAELDEIARALRCETATTLVLGLNGAPEYLKVDQLLRRAAQALPEVQLELVTSSSYLIADQVRENKLDLGHGVVEKELAQHWASRGGICILANTSTNASLNLVVRRDRAEHKPVAAIIEMTRRLWQESLTLEA